MRKVFEILTINYTREIEREWERGIWGMCRSRGGGGGRGGGTGGLDTPSEKSQNKGFPSNIGPAPL